MLNTNTVSFLVRNKIDLKKFKNINSSHIYDTNEINSLVAKYGFYYDRENASISIGDIIGYEKSINQSSNIFYSLGNYFDSSKDLYHARCVELLEYSSNDLLEVLKKSFIDHPIIVNEIPNNKYIINTNGFHRYTVLRAHFVNESYNMDIDSDEYAKIKKKYEIPLQLRKLDLTMTYCKFLLVTNPNFKGKIKPEVDNNYNSTGNVILELSNSKQLILNDNDLIKLIGLVIENTNSEHFFKLVAHYYNKYEDFKIFMNMNFPTLNLEQINNEKIVIKNKLTNSYIFKK